MHHAAAAPWSVGVKMAALLARLLITVDAALGEPQLSHPAVKRGGAACSDDWSCSLGGECRGGACVCDHWTTGPQCNLLHLEHLKRNISSYGLQMPAYHSWGGHAVADAGGVWNGFFSFMCKHKSLSAWTTASSIVRATAHSIDGPYTVQQMAVQPWAHNAFLTQEPSTKEWLLYHIGTAVAPEAGWAPCVIPNASTHEPKPAAPAPKCKVGRTGNLAVRSSKSLLGPWEPLSILTRARSMVASTSRSHSHGRRSSQVILLRLSLRTVQRFCTSARNHVRMAGTMATKVQRLASTLREQKTGKVLTRR